MYSPSALNSAMSRLFHYNESINSNRVYSIGRFNHNEYYKITITSDIFTIIFESSKLKLLKYQSILSEYNNSINDYFYLKTDYLKTETEGDILFSIPSDNNDISTDISIIIECDEGLFSYDFKCLESSPETPMIPTDCFIDSEKIYFNITEIKEDILTGITKLDKVDVKSITSKYDATVDEIKIGNWYVRNVWDDLKDKDYGKKISIKRETPYVLLSSLSNDFTFKISNLGREKHGPQQGEPFIPNWEEIHNNQKYSTYKFINKSSIPASGIKFVEYSKADYDNHLITVAEKNLLSTNRKTHPGDEDVDPDDTSYEYWGPSAVYIYNPSTDGLDPYLTKDTYYEYDLKIKGNVTSVSQNNFAGAVFAQSSNGVPYTLYGGFRNSNALNMTGDENTPFRKEGYSFMTIIHGDYYDGLPSEDFYKEETETPNDIQYYYHDPKNFVKLHLDTNDYATVKIIYNGLEIKIYAKDENNKFIRVGNTIELEENSKIAFGIFSRDGFGSQANRTVSIKDAKLTQYSFLERNFFYSYDNENWSDIQYLEGEEIKSKDKKLYLRGINNETALQYATYEGVTTKTNTGETVVSKKYNHFWNIDPDKNLIHFYDRYLQPYTSFTNGFSLSYDEKNTDKKYLSSSYNTSSTIDSIEAGFALSTIELPLTEETKYEYNVMIKSNVTSAKNNNFAGIPFAKDSDGKIYQLYGTFRNTNPFKNSIDKNKSFFVIRNEENITYNLIRKSEVANDIESTGYGNTSYYSNNTNDKVFLMSRPEVKNEKYGFSNSDFSVRQKKVSEYSKQLIKNTENTINGDGWWWWLRTPNSSEKKLAHKIKTDGSMDSSNTTLETGGILPAMWVKLNANIEGFETPIKDTTTNKVIFGKYPQTLCTSSDVSKLNNELKKFNESDWSTNKTSDFIDITLGNDKYRAVKKKSSDEVLWFSFDNIYWTILAESEDGYALILSDLILDIKYFDNEEDNNYEYSYIRSWLNNEFLVTAFEYNNYDAYITERDIVNSDNYKKVKLDDEDYTYLKVAYNGLKVSVHILRDAVSEEVQVGDEIELSPDSKIVFGIFNNDSTSRSYRTMSIKQANILALNNEAMNLMTDTITDENESKNITNITVSKFQIAYNSIKKLDTRGTFEIDGKNILVSGKLSALLDYRKDYDFPVDTDIYKCSSIAPFAFAGLFANNDSIIDVSGLELPAILFKNGKAAIGAFFGLFKNCVNLERPALIKTKTIVPYCYSEMYNGCTILDKLPKIGNIENKQNEYILTSDPDSYDEKFVYNSFSKMFANCLNIKVVKKEEYLENTKNNMVIIKNYNDFYTNPYTLPASDNKDYTDMFKGTNGYYQSGESGVILFTTNPIVL